MIMSNQVLDLKWNNHKETFFSNISKFRNKHSYTDVTLICNGQFYEAHKLVLSSCSEYFEEIFEKINNKYPIIILRDIKPLELEAILNYIYLGHVEVSQNDLPSLIKSAECLKIKGLASSDDEESKSEKKSMIKKDIEEKSMIKKDSEEKSNKRKLITIDNGNNTKHIKLSPGKHSNTISTGESSEIFNLGDVVTIKEEPECTVIENEENIDSDLLEDFTKEEYEGEAEQEIIAYRDTSDINEPAGEWSISQQSAQVDDIKYNASTSEETNHMERGNKHEDAVQPCANVNMPFECEYCRKRFKKKYHYKEHVRIHTGQRPFECNICPKKFNTNGNLKKHMLIHISGKHQCPHCFFNTSQASEMSKHISTHFEDTIMLDF